MHDVMLCRNLFDGRFHRQNSFGTVSRTYKQILQLSPSLTHINRQARCPPWFPFSNSTTLVLVRRRSNTVAKAQRSDLLTSRLSSTLTIPQWIRPIYCISKRQMWSRKLPPRWRLALPAAYEIIVTDVLLLHSLSSSRSASGRDSALPWSPREYQSDGVHGGR